MSVPLYLLSWEYQQVILHSRTSSGLSPIRKWGQGYVLLGEVLWVVFVQTPGGRFRAMGGITLELGGLETFRLEITWRILRLEGKHVWEPKSKTNNSA